MPKLVALAVALFLLASPTSATAEEPPSTGNPSAGGGTATPTHRRPTRRAPGSTLRVGGTRAPRNPRVVGPTHVPRASPHFVGGAPSGGSYRLVRRIQRGRFVWVRVPTTPIRVGGVSPSHAGPVVRIHPTAAPRVVVRQPMSQAKGPCEKLRRALEEARAALAEIDCGPAREAYRAAETALAEARAAMEAERRRRDALRQDALAARDAQADSQRALDDAAKALDDAQQALLDDIAAYFARNNTPDSDLPGALSFARPEGVRDSELAQIDLGQGITVWWHVGRYDQAMREDMAGRVAGYLRSRVLSRSRRAALAQAQAAVASAQQQLGAAAATYATADARWSGLAPLDLDIRRATAARDAAKAALDDCLERRAAAQDRVDRLASAYDACVKRLQAHGAVADAHAAVADSGEAVVDSGADVQRTIAQTGTVPGERVRRHEGSASRAQDRAEGLQAQAEIALAEAQGQLAAGNAEAASAAAQTAREKAAAAAVEARKARQAAQAAGERAATESERIRKRIEETARAEQEARERNERKARAAEAARRRAALRWMLTQAIESSRSDLSAEDLAKLQALLRDVEKAGQDMDALLGHLERSHLTEADLDRMLAKLRKRLQAVVDELGKLAERVDKIASLYAQYKQVVDHLGTLLSDDDSVEGRAKKMGAVLGLLDETIGTITDRFPILSWVAGYLTLLSDAYLAAIDAIPAIVRGRYEEIIETALGGTTALDLYAQGYTVDQIVDRLFPADVRRIQGTHDEALFLAAARAAVMADLTRAAQEALR